MTTTYDAIYGDTNMAQCKARGVCSGACATPAATGPGDAIEDPLHCRQGPSQRGPSTQRRRDADDKVASAGCCGGQGLEITGKILAGIGLGLAAIAAAGAVVVGAVAVGLCAAIADSGTSRVILI